MKKLLLIVFAIFSVNVAVAQCTGINAGTPTTTSVCYDFDAVPPISGSSVCAGAGHGGSGQVRIVRFCTNASASCLVFNTSGLAGTNGISYAIYSTCTGGGSLSGYVSGSGACDGNTTTSTYTTSGVTLAANTCYYLRIWTKDPPSLSATSCIYTKTPPNDVCTGAAPISTTPQSFDNYCTTPGPTTNTPTITPAMLCAGSLENTAWYSFTVQNTGDVIITISNIVCSGGGSGFQIGYFIGSCGTLSNIGCSSGSGGTVTATITGLTAGQQVIIAIDGNAGANCTYTISATNTAPLPITLINFEATYQKNIKKVVTLWETASEINNDYFTIERSKDGYTFEVVGIVDGSGNSQMVKNYSLNDAEPYKGISYYRLKQTDYDGTSDYSELVAVEVESDLVDLVFSPNPVEEEGYLTFTSNSTFRNVNIVIYDIFGRIVITDNVVVQKGENRFKLNTKDLAKGMYNITIVNDFNNKLFVKFIKD